MRRVYIPFTTENLELLRRGLKTTTLRSLEQSYKIGLDIGESGQFEKFKVTHHGPRHVDEVGGLEGVWVSEGFDHTSLGKPMFKQTNDFLEGKIKLHYYTFELMEDWLDD